MALSLGLWFLGGVTMGTIIFSFHTDDGIPDGTLALGSAAVGALAGLSRHRQWAMVTVDS
ncbi:hypothetical protein AK966_06455 [Vibrio sp. PID23_8]|jgi:hypothetical protein|nr:hypothetical protein AK965_06810 [Vibrio sp. PID17_43]RIZ54989.1 hypothetical protein AK966_06455 [Vibrio sp. PID23_8]